LRGSALNPLIGREEEVALLLRRWARAKGGDGQMVLISGEPGIGKSRITAELEGRLQAEPHIRLRYFCSPYHQDSALYPFVDQLGRASGFAPDEPPAARLEKLEALLARAVPSARGETDRGAGWRQRNHRESRVARVDVPDFLQQGFAYPFHDAFDHLLIGRGEPMRLRRRFRAGLLLDVLHHVDQHLGRAQIGAGGFVDQLSDDRLALGDLAALSVNRDENGLVQRSDKQRRQVFLGPTARVAGLALLKAGVQWRLAVAAYSRSVSDILPSREYPPIYQRLHNLSIW
jgi:hypothetical protein